MILTTLARTVGGGCSKEEIPETTDGEGSVEFRTTTCSEVDSQTTRAQTSLPDNCKPSGNSFKLVVIKGTVGTTASDPATVQGNLYNGDKQRDYPLWRVKIEGLSITKVEQLYEIGVTNADLSNSISQLNDNFNIEEVQISLNISDFTLNTTWAHKQGKQVIIYPYVTGKPTKGTTIATGFPIPLKQVNIRDAGFGIVTLDESGRLYISSAAVTTSSYFIMPLSYFTE